MWQPYKDVTRTYLPNAIVAVDPFHVVKHLTQDFSQLRIDLMNQCEYGSNACYLLKRWHWLLMKDDVTPRYTTTDLAWPLTAGIFSI